MTKILCVCDANEPYDVMKRFKALERWGAEVSLIEDSSLNEIELITDRMLLLEQQGVNAAPTCKELLENCEDKDILVVHCASINKEIIDAAKNVKLIAILRGGTENADKAYLAEKNITLIHSPWRSANAVADFTVGMMIAENKNIARSHTAIKAGNWRKSFVNQSYIHDLRNCRVGLIGLGYIGERVAERLVGFGCEIAIYDPFFTDEQIRAKGYLPVTEKDLLETSDFVSLHLRLVKETEKYMTKEKFSLMKEEAYFINTARSGLVDTNALIWALEERLIGGAAIDVYDVEPLPEDSPFLTLDNVTLTSHLAGFSADTVFNSVEICFEDIENFLQNKPLINICKN
ncbi:3-phosphoglycerate dehydrogenase [Listeria monocytogenes]|nr:3-phosphoglycerate dehydrogenase [Listeria monocytogenes]